MFLDNMLKAWAFPVHIELNGLGYRSVRVGASENRHLHSLMDSSVLFGYRSSVSVWHALSYRPTLLKLLLGELSNLPSSRENRSSSHKRSTCAIGTKGPMPAHAFE